MRVRVLATAVVLTVVASPLVTGSANSAATELGQVFNAGEACGGSGSLTGLQTVSSTPSYTIPAAGVITSVRMGSNTTRDVVRAFKLGRPTTGGAYTIVGEGPAITIPAAQTSSQIVRIPAQAGDVLGYAILNPNTACTSQSTTSDGFALFTGNLAVGTTANPGVTGTSARFPVAATLEADADNDGHGDTTQDLCPTDATTQAACKTTTPTPSPSATPAPLPDINFGRYSDGRIKAPKPGKKAKKTAKVTVVFAGNSSTVSYRCSVDGAAYVPCSSPFTPRLKKGKHTVTIQAVDAAGRVDPTPPTVPVKVTKARKRA